MDGDSVTEKLSEKYKNISTITEAFIYIFPQYLLMGMSYDEFWNGPAILAKAYREAHEQRQRQEEWGRWRMGAYIYDAMLRVAPVFRQTGKAVEPGKYPDEPWPLTQKEYEEREVAREKQRYEQYIANMRAKSDYELSKRAKQSYSEEVSENGGN